MKRFLSVALLLSPISAFGQIVYPFVNDTGTSSPNIMAMTNNTSSPLTKLITSVHVRSIALRTTAASKTYKLSMSTDGTTNTAVPLWEQTMTASNIPLPAEPYYFFLIKPQPAPYNNKPQFLSFSSNDPTVGNAGPVVYLTSDLGN